MRNNSFVIDTTHGLIHFPYMAMQIKTTSSETTAKPQPFITDDALTIPPRTTETITPYVDHPSEWNTTGTVTLLEKFTKTASLLVPQSTSTRIDKGIAVRVANTTESPYLIKKNTQIAEFSLIALEQSRHNKSIDMVIFSMILQGDHDVTAYIGELLRTNKLEQQNNTLWLPTPENTGKRENHTPLQTRTLNELK